MPQILTNSSAAGASAFQVWGGGDGSFEASGTFNGATLTLQSKNQDGTYTDVPNTAMTATGKLPFKLPPCAIRVNASAATPTSVNAAAWRVRNP